MMVDRDVSFERPSRAANQGDDGAQRERISGRATTAATRCCAMSLRCPCRRDRGHRRRRRQWPDRACRGAFGTAAAEPWRRHAERPGYPSLSPAGVREAGLAHVPGDRMVRGVDGNASIAANMHDGPAAPRRRGSAARCSTGRPPPAKSRQADQAVRHPRAGSRRHGASGFRAAISRRSCWPRIHQWRFDFLLIDQPTRGVDIGAQEAIHDEIMRQRENGVAILLISVQLDELLSSPTGSW